MPVLLVVDDEASILHAFGRVFREPEVTLITADTAEKGIAQVRKHQPDVVILDIKLPDMSGLDVYRRINEIDAKIPVIFITGHGTTDTAIESIKLGALDYLFKPLDLNKLRQVVQSAFEVSHRMRVPAVLAGADSSDELSDLLVGRCEAMNEVYKLIGRVAPQDVPVLILGESGTGKELVARAIWSHSRRSDSHFLAVNCAAIPESLLESELFGHEKGAFTGADQLRIGRFEQCSGGTLFLDEIGDMAPLAQAKILRVLQDQQFERVGGNETIKTDVRVIAATNRNLEELLPSSQFRSDLYYRLSVFSIKLPPLRERGEDLDLLVDHFLKRFSHELKKEAHKIDPETLKILKQYPWPGNVRELQSVIKQSLLQAVGPVLIPDFLPDAIRGAYQPRVAKTSLPDASDLAGWDRFIDDRLESGTEDLYAESTALMERYLLVRVLQHTSGNQLQAARILGITRSTLRGKLRSLGIDAEDLRWSNIDQA